MIVLKKRCLKTEMSLAGGKLNEMLLDGTIEQIILDYPEDFFIMSNVHKSIIAEKVKGFIPFEIGVSTYRPKWPWSKAKAYINLPKKGWNIFLNKYKLNRGYDSAEKNIASLTGTMGHEWGHLLEKWVHRTVEEGMKFNHGNNDPEGKENTFQYYLGREIKAHILRSL